MEKPTLYERVGGREGLLRLLKYFYADVRQQNDIGPIFGAHVDNWPAHMEKIADFWSGVTGGPARYPGGMPWKHTPLGLEEKHFQAWLGLWRDHCNAHLAPREAAEMIARAEMIGQRLREMISLYGTKPPA
ncbi:MAG: group III truncated hemoglobin [Verrucomicrobiota bacterium]